jgi:hypothetical protein
MTKRFVSPKPCTIGSSNGSHSSPETTLQETTISVQIPELSAAKVHLQPLSKEDYKRLGPNSIHSVHGIAEMFFLGCEKQSRPIDSDHRDRQVLATVDPHSV